MTDLPSTFFYDLKRSDYPFVLRLYDETTGELVWETTVTEPGTTKIPGRAETGATSVRSEIEFPGCIVRATSDGRTWTRRK